MSDRLIYDGQKSKVFCRTEDNGQRFAVKVLNYEFPTPEDIARFHNEFDIMDGLKLPSSRSVVRKTRENNRHVLIMEWGEGLSLKDVFHDKSGDIVDALHIAIAAAEALGEIHAHKIIHKNVTPHNFIVDLQERRVKLIGFGMSTTLDLRQPFENNLERIEGTLAYISPEQTGRMNRAVDYRTDLYSLGVSLYEILAGDVPFTGAGAMEVVHAHLAQVPKSLVQVNPSVPKVLSDIVGRLLEKNADNRYQSARGLKADLQRCLAAYEKHGGVVEPFEIGKADHASAFRLPQTLYGRENEVSQIIQTFEDCANGAKKLLLVAGHSGTGKTALVHEVHRPITARRGRFCSGKFDQLQRATPHFAFLQAFRELVDGLLTEDEDKLSDLRSRLQDAFGDEGSVLTSVLPNLEIIVGAQPPVPQVGGAEAQNRFHYLFRKFVRVLATADHPVVLLIDDLQWADAASLELLRVLMTDPDAGHLLLICAYRDNEVDPTHPFMRTLDELIEAGLTPDRINVGNLTQADLTGLLRDALDASADTVAPLARLVHDKTRGNAFFATEFMKSFADEGLLQLDAVEGRWTWDATRIEQKNIADNVVGLMANKVLRLEPSCQEILQTAACVGNRFDIETLCWVADEDRETVLLRLKPSLAESLILPLGGDVYKFSHDRIQQAVYALLEDDARPPVHLKIGRRLHAHIGDGSDATRLFDVVNQLNLGRALLVDLDEQILLARLNLDAGRRAKSNSAFSTSLDYFECAISLLAQAADPWTDFYDLSLALYSEASEAAYLCAKFEMMDLWFHEIIERARTTLDKVKPYEIRILAFKAENKLMEAIETGLELLEQLGERFPAKPNMSHVVYDLARTRFALRGRSNDDLMALPLMTNPKKSAAMRVITDIMSSAYWGRPTLVPLIAFRMVRMSLAYGNHPASCFAYGSYGVLMCGVLGRMREGYRFGHLALDLIEKLDAKEWKAQIFVTPYALIFHWNEHVRNTLRPLQQSFQIGLETGLIEFACVNTNIYCIQAYLCGYPLDRLETETGAYSVLYKQFKQETNYNYNEVFRQAMLNLMGRSADPVVLTGEAYDEDVMLAQNLERSDKTGTFFIHFNKLLLCYQFRRYDEALVHAQAARGLLDAVLAKFEIPNFYFYEALTCIALAERATGQKRFRLIARARLDIAKLKRWAKTAPENYRHKYDLCCAELARIQGRDNTARQAYDRAAAGASANDYLHEQALAYELAGRYEDQKGRSVLAEFNLKAAYNTYREWGAKAKLQDLSESFPKYLSAASNAMSTTGLATAVGSVIDGSTLDISTVLKASTLISGEVVPSQLLTLLMGIVLENAGAQRGFLLLDSDAGLLVQAHGEGGGKSLWVMQATPLDDRDDLSIPLIKFVHRTGESIVISDAATDGRTMGQTHLEQHQPKSILCLPIINQGKSVGVLYLENNLSVGAFTRDRVDLLTLLSGQIAVSIDNAMLYEQLEQKVTERTAELEQEKRKSDDLLLNILPAETAQELKQHGHAVARHYDRVTVLFTDFEGFTERSATLAPTDLVNEIDECFKAFDLIAEKHRIEKIKTIGDAYMAVGGLPVRNSTHAENVVNAALDMRDFMRQRNGAGGGNGMGIRIGIHTGPVVAGIVGLKKFQYDIWGDTVNTAARMESAGKVDHVNVSEVTYGLVKDKFEARFRGEIEAKGKGKIPMYFIDAILQDD